MAVYYVNPSYQYNGNGTLDSAASSAGQPGAFNSVANMVARAGGYLPGDVIDGGGFTYNEKLIPPSSGAVGNPIVLRKLQVSGKKITVPGDWSVHAGNVWKMALTKTSLGHVLFGSMQGAKQASIAACTHPLDWYFATNVLYVYSATHPIIQYGGVSPILLDATPSSGIDINGKSYLRFTQCALDNFAVYGIWYRGASSNVTFDYCVFDKNIVTGVNDIGVLAQDTASGLVFNNCDFYRMYRSIATSANINPIVGKNNRFFGIRAEGISSAYVTFSNSLFYGNCAVATSPIDGGPAVDGGGNIFLTDPKVKSRGKYPVYMGFACDDVTDTNLDYFQNTLMPMWEVRGLKMSLPVICGQAGAPTVAALNAWHAAGHDIVSHSWAHQNITQLAALTIRYTGNATTALMTTTASALTIVLAGQSDGSAGLALDLTAPAYDQIAALCAYINSQTGYTCTKAATSSYFTHTSTLAAVTNVDIKTADYNALYNATLLTNDEVVRSKSFLESVVPGLTVKSYVYPQTYTSTTEESQLEAAGYIGGRGGMVAGTGMTQWYGSGVNSQNVLSYKAENYSGKTREQIFGLVGSIAFGAALTGYPVMFFIDRDNLIPTEIGHLLDAIVAHGIYDTYTSMFTRLRAGGLNVQGTNNYTYPAENAENFHQGTGSPCINAGVDVGLTTDFDGRAIKGLPDIGAYEYMAPRRGGGMSLDIGISL